MLHVIAGDNSDPLFQVISAGSRIPLTDAATRKHLMNISLNLNLSPALTFHSFRNAWPAWGFQHGVSFFTGPYAAWELAVGRCVEIYIH